jgi:transcriptional regulator with GAF, ATPase, and Fis domain/tetratricopeptide (TPR) repeat protein
MIDTTGPRDNLQALRAQVIVATSPAERVKATLLLAEKLWLTVPAEAEPLLEQVVSSAEAAGETKTRARAASMLSELSRRAGDVEAGARYAEVVLEAARTTGDQRIRVSGFNLIGMVHQERGELHRAQECFEECLQLSRETGFDLGERAALNQLAGTHGLQGQSSKALECYRQCLESSTKAGDAFGRAVHLHNIGWTLELMGRWNEATESFHRTIAVCEEHSFHDLMLAARMALGELSLKRSDYQDAALIFGAVIEAERATHHSGRLLRDALSNLGWTHFRGGDVARAEMVLDEVAHLGETAGDRSHLVTVSRRRAELALTQGRLDAAAALLVQATRHASDLNLNKEQGEVLRVEALLSEAHARTGASLDLFLRSETALEPLGDTYELALTRLQHGRLLVGLGRPEDALPLLQTAARTFHRLSVVAEAEEAGRLLYRLEIRADRNAALAQGLAGLASLDLVPEQFIERALLILCDNLRFEQGAILTRGSPVALRGQPDLAGLPKRRAMLLQTDAELLLPVRQGRRLLGFVWLRRRLPLATRVGPELLEMVSRALAPPLAKLGELKAIETGRAPQIPGLRFRGVVGRNPEVLDVLSQIPRVAATTVPVLICGESGSGKELVARALHESGPRADHPFVTVNCAAVPESLLEAEFFGVEEGAATGVAARPGKFELADEGTIFLDEIGDMSPALQAKLLRVIEGKLVARVGGSKEMSVDVWVIAATNMDLESRVRQGRFRNDLLYRLNTIPFVLPPLRRRPEDLPALVDYFVTCAAQTYNRTLRGASKEAVGLLAACAWPGNIRQLRHIIERAVILASGDTLETTDLPSELRLTRPAPAARPVAGMRGKRRKVAAKAERQMLRDALRHTDGNASEAAKLAGYSRAHFYRLLSKYNIAR